MLPKYLTASTVPKCDLNILTEGSGFDVQFEHFVVFLLFAELCWEEKTEFTAALYIM
jgi:hypothetical protein